MEIILSIILPAIAAFGLAYYVGNNIILKKKREEILKSMKADKSAVVVESSEESETPVTGSNKGIKISRFKGL